MEILDQAKAYLKQKWPDVVASVLAAVAALILASNFISLSDYWAHIASSVVLAAAVLFLLRQREPADPPPQGPGEDAEKEEAKKKIPPTRRGKILAIGWFTVSTLLLVEVLSDKLQDIEPPVKVSMAWSPTGDVELLDGPAKLLYVKGDQGNELQYYGEVDDDVRQQLLDAFPSPPESKPSADELSYREAINKLAFESRQNETATVDWRPDSEDLTLQPGPAVFFRDVENGRLSYEGKVDDAAKQQLLALYPVDADQQAAIELYETNKASYQHAIGQLALISAQEYTVSMLALILVGALGGAIGAEIRLITTFIGNACYKKTLDQEIWWPTYVLNPLLGFLMGGLVVVLVASGWLNVENDSTRGNLWWLGLAALAGFGIMDLSERLRLVTKAAFGVDSGKQNEGKDDADKPAGKPSGNGNGDHDDGGGDDGGGDDEDGDGDDGDNGDNGDKDDGDGGQGDDGDEGAENGDGDGLGATVENENDEGDRDDDLTLHK